MTFLIYETSGMRTNHLLITIFLAALVLSYSCKKSSQESENDSPVISLTSPIDNQVFVSGSSVNIAGNIHDAHKITEVHFHISNNTTGVLLIDIHRYPDASNYLIDESFQAHSGIQYKIQVIAKDNFVNEARATLLVSSN
jgi:hypothetical protein